jgi:phosphoglycolate phosphatase
MIRAALFDLDGTLVDSLDDIASALDAALVDHALPIPTRPQVRSWIGGGARNLVAHTVDAARVDAVLARFRVHYAATPVRHTRVYAGLDTVLDRFVGTGIRLAVLTNKPHALAVPICAALLARWPFAPILGQREGVAIKPDPTTALAIAAELGVPPAACAFIGDSEIDLETAHSAGMRAVGVTWGFRPRAELEALKPDLLADAPEQLLALLT